MTQDSALAIADTWNYEGIYSFYDAAADEEDYQELIDPAQRKSNYYEVLNNNELFGYLVIIPKDTNIVELGLGLRPDLTGRGLGQAFIKEALQFLMTSFPIVTHVELSVAAFNKRAFKVYQAVGFSEGEHFLQATNGGSYDFIKMSKKIK